MPSLKDRLFRRFDGRLEEERISLFAGWFQLFAGCFSLLVVLVDGDNKSAAYLTLGLLLLVNGMSYLLTNRRRRLAVALRIVALLLALITIGAGIAGLLR